MVRFTGGQCDVMDALFRRDKYPEMDECTATGVTIGLTGRQVLNYIIRKREKLKKTEYKTNKEGGTSDDEPSAEEEKTSKKMARFSKAQREHLDKVFAHDNNPNREKRIACGAEIGLNERQVDDYFVRQRRKWRYLQKTLANGNPPMLPPTWIQGICSSSSIIGNHGFSVSTNISTSGCLASLPSSTANEAVGMEPDKFEFRKWDDIAWPPADYLENNFESLADFEDSSSRPRQDKEENQDIAHSQSPVVLSFSSISSSTDNTLLDEIDSPFRAACFASSRGAASSRNTRGAVPWDNLNYHAQIGRTTVEDEDPFELTFFNNRP